jgi:HD-GYP domain-containing protein (c-di-GMP phosphodiesterase class II)
MSAPPTPLRFTALSNVQHRLAPGCPLPFNVRDAEHALLLARGQVVAGPAQLAALCERGALVDLHELQSGRDKALQAPRAALPALWHEGLTRIDKALARSPGHAFATTLDDASVAVMGLIERDPDLAIFQVLAHDAGASADARYGVQRALHTAITSWLVGHRLGWSPEALARAFKVALTMNLSMLALQGRLARQRQPLTDAQRAEIATHPMRSVELLMQAGIDDDDWLQAVARHHEHEDGSGYPTGRRDVGELASLVRRADVYTAKLASRSHRQALSAEQAGRQMFMHDRGHPMTAALVKEFGLYPPGSYVRLVDGHTGVVVARGPTLTTPIVACLSDEHGAPLPAPLRVDSALKRFRIRGPLGQGCAPQPPGPRRIPGVVG